MPTDLAATRRRPVQQLLLVYLYLLLFGPGVYLGSQGTAKIFADWIVLLFALLVSVPYWRELRFARAGIWAYAAYVGWYVLISLLTSGSSIHKSVVHLGAYIFGAIRPLLIFVAFGSLVRGALLPKDREETAQLVWRHLVVLTPIFGVLAVAQLLGPYAIHAFFMSLWPRRDDRFFIAPEGATWVSVTFDGYYHIFGLFMAMGAVLCLTHLARRAERPTTPVAWAGFLLASLVVFLSQSRSALAGLIGGIALVLVTGNRGSRRRVAWAVAPALALIVGLALGWLSSLLAGRWDPSYAAQKFASLLSPETALGSGLGTSDATGRLLFWQVHIEHFLAHPIRGSGAYEAVSDSLYLVLLGEGGIIGTGIFLSSIAALAVGLARLRRQAAPLAQTLGNAGLAALAALLAGAYGVGTLQGDRLGQVFFLLGAVALGAYYPGAPARAAPAVEAAETPRPSDAGPDAPV